MAIESETAMEVAVLESAMVMPSEPTPGHSIWLSNLDILIGTFYVTTFYCYKPNGDTAFFSPEAMKAALAKALVPFYPLAGRLAPDATGRLQLNCTGEGVFFVLARSESRIEDLEDFAPSEKLRRMLLPDLDASAIPSIVFVFQLTFFECGGVCLGTAGHHAAVDGESALSFINTWSSIARGVSDPVDPPFLDRTLLRARSPPTVVFKHEEYLAGPGTTKPAKPPAFETAILKLSKTQLLSLKKNSVASKAEATSTFKAFAAHAWRSACKARELSEDQETRLTLSVDARTRVIPPLPSNFLGNAVLRVAAVASAGEIIGNGVNFAAKRISEATTRLTDEYVRSVVDNLEVQGPLGSMDRRFLLPSENNLTAISWLRLPLYEADFGWGRPNFMGRVAPGYPGFVYLMRCPEDDGGVTVILELETESMAKFKKIFYDDLEMEKKSSMGSHA